MNTTKLRELPHFPPPLVSHDEWRPIYDDLRSVAEQYRAEMERLRAVADFDAEMIVILSQNGGKAEAERDELRFRLKDWEDNHKAIVAGDCAPDEKHCSCVPSLRKELAALRKDYDHAASAWGGETRRAEAERIRNVELRAELAALREDMERMVKARDDAANAEDGRAHIIAQMRARLKHYKHEVERWENPYQRRAEAGVIMLFESELKLLEADGYHGAELPR